MRNHHSYVTSSIFLNFIFYVYDRWNDERYGWNPSDYEGLTSIPLPFSTSWAPDLVLVNAAEDKFIDRQVGVVKSNGDIVYVVGVLTKSNCAPNYNNYPFGIQTCQVRFIYFYLFFK